MNKKRKYSQTSNDSTISMLLVLCIVVVGTVAAYYYMSPASVQATKNQPLFLPEKITEGAAPAGNVPGPASRDSLGTSAFVPKAPTTPRTKGFNRAFSHSVHSTGPVGNIAVGVPDKYAAVFVDDKRPFPQYIPKTS